MLNGPEFEVGVTGDNEVVLHIFNDETHQSATIVMSSDAAVQRANLILQSAIDARE